MGSIADPAGTTSDPQGSLAALRELGIAHDLRAPLRTALDELALAQAGTMDGKASASVAAAKRHLRRMQQFLEDVLSIGAPAAPESLRLEELARELAHDLGTKVSVQGRCEITADPVAVRRIVQNLLQNALEHGTPPISIVLTGHGFQVVDAGPGLPSDMLSALSSGGPMPRQGTRGLGMELTRLLIVGQGWRLGAVGTFPMVLWGKRP